MIKAGELLQPLLTVLEKQLLTYPVTHCDETVVQLLKEPDKQATSNSYMWVRVGGPPTQPIRLFHYAPSRSGSVVSGLLESYQGYLQTDDYAGYNAVTATKGVTQLGCWAHARRKFIEVQKTTVGKTKNAIKPRNIVSKADMAVSLIAKLYAIEKSIIADFVTHLDNEIVNLFQQVLLVCDESGLIEKKMFVIDSCKLPSDASREWSGTHEELEHKSKKMRTAVKFMLEKHKANDNTGTTEAIKEREREQIKTLEKNANKIDAFLKNNEKRIGHRGKEVKSNVTDNESVKMKTSHGTIQGYTGIATVDEQNQIIIQADVHGEGQEHGLLKKIVESIKTNLNAIGPKTKKSH
jgi:hypothetical protein